MIIAIPFRGPRPNKNMFRSQNFSEILKIANENKLPENKKGPLCASGPNLFDSNCVYRDAPRHTYEWSVNRYQNQ